MAEVTQRLEVVEAAMTAMHQWVLQQQEGHEVVGQHSLVKPPKPEVYSGGPNPDTWVFALSVYFAAVNIVQDAQRIAFASALLRGAALDWWRFTLVHQPPPTWDAFTRALISQFMPIAAERLARDQLARLRQSDGPVRRYIFEFRRLLLRVTDITAADALHRFITGLKPQLAREVNIRDPPDLETAMSIAQRADLFNYRARMAANLTSRHDGGGGPAPMELGNMNVSGARRFEGYCRSCGRWGHKAQFCKSHPKGNGTGPGAPKPRPTQGYNNRSA